MIFKICLLVICCICLLNCDQPVNKKETPANIVQQQETIDQPSYTEIINEIKNKKKDFYKKYKEGVGENELMSEVRDYWINSLGTNLYEQWKSTPWDFNGTTRKPKEGAIACGYFVTTLLLDMGYQLNRTKLSTCASLTMMKALTSKNAIRNLSYLSYKDFNEKIKQSGKGVFIAGLDFHTGFLINDGTETWFLHSNYINREGVVKEKIMESEALKASGTRFITCLTNDKDFLLRWINNQ